MNKGDFCEMLSRYAAEYSNSGVLKSVEINNHMNNYKGEIISQDTIDAILVDFVNFIGMKQGIDYDLCVSDLVNQEEIYESI
jgi:hypothetical protein